MYACVLFLTVTPCGNRIGLLDEALLTSSVLGTRTSATSYNSPHEPMEARKSRFGWCSNYLTCNSTTDEYEYIEIDFGVEVVVEAISTVSAGGGYVTQYYVQYARSNGEYNCIREQISNQTVHLHLQYILCIPINYIFAGVCWK